MEKKKITIIGAGMMGSGNMKNSAVRFLKMSTIIILKIGKRSSRVPISSSAESPLSAWIGF